MDNNLIFDLGFHTGQDTLYYLKKGFNVVAVEANPFLYETGVDKFQEYIKNDQLILINNAVSVSNESINFFIHKNHSDWSSCFKDYINYENENDLTEVNVGGITLEYLVSKFSTPRYIKVDVEGADVIVAEQLTKLSKKPKFISFETSRRDYAKIFSFLFLSGYKKFQLINQEKYNNLKLFNLNNEGNPIDYVFNLGSSGVFGNDLNPEKWIDYSELLRRYVKFIELRSLDMENLSLGWIDVHARYDE
jgi:FkbM family methyltransferase